MVCVCVCLCDVQYADPNTRARARARTRPPRSCSLALSRTSTQRVQQDTHDMLQRLSGVVSQIAAAKRAERDRALSRISGSHLKRARKKESYEKKRGPLTHAHLSASAQADRHALSERIKISNTGGDATQTGAAPCHRHCACAPPAAGPVAVG